MIHRSNNINAYDQYLFNEGSHFRSYRVLGAHPGKEKGREGVYFAVWAPRAQEVRVIGDFNGWRGDGHSMRRYAESGIWGLFVPGLGPGDLYKYEIVTAYGTTIHKADPYAFWAEIRPNTASRIFFQDRYIWGDDCWLRESQASLASQPLAIYEIHLGSWRRKADGEFYTYRELAELLPDYVAGMGFTHIELLPLAEHPLDGSWGYQATGYYAPTSRYGNPDDFKFFVDRCHQKGIGVLLDWVPGHFCKDDHGLRCFDGAPLYESGFGELAENPDWGTLNFDLARTQVWSFLISNALYWLDVFHIDGLRVDAVANMLYRDYGKAAGQWLPNCHGGKENLEAAAFIKKLNEAVHQYHPQALVIAEESTTWPALTKPVDANGLGFDFKWNIGWMNDTLRYVALDPVYRAYEHHLLTFSLMYAFSEKFLLPLSHDEVVHGKKSLLDKMPGDYWQKHANLRAFYGYFMAHPGKKLLFMGGEFGQFTEWSEERGLDWLLLDFEMHRNVQQCLKDLNRHYQQDRSFWEMDDNWQGFAWIDCADCSQSIISFMRKATDGDFTVVLCNFTPVVRHEYRVGVPVAGLYREVFNSDWVQYGGSGQTNPEITASERAWHGQPCSISITVPPLATVYLKCSVLQREEETDALRRMCGDDSGRRTRQQTGRLDQKPGQTSGSLRRKVPVD